MLSWSRTCLGRSVASSSARRIWTQFRDLEGRPADQLLYRRNYLRRANCCGERRRAYPSTPLRRT